MKRALILTILLLLAGTVSALADTATPKVGTAVVTLNNHTVFRASFALVNPSMPVTEAMLLANNPATHYHSNTNGGTATFSTNVRPTRWKVKRSTWTYTGDYPNSNQQLVLWLKSTLGTGVGSPNTGTIINNYANNPDGAQISTSYTDFVNVPGGTSTRPLSFKYALSGVDIQLRPGTYSTTVSYTMYKP